MGNGDDLLMEDGGKGLVAAALDSKVNADICEARLEFGGTNMENKMYNDLGVKESELGPKDSLVTGKLA